jgi:hypothetical protein
MITTWVASTDVIVSHPPNPSRRTVLAAAGAAVGTTALGGVAYAATQDGSTDENDSTDADASQDPAVQWTETYSSGSSDQAVTVVPSSDGGYTFLGHAQDEDESTSGVWLVGVDESGAKQWEARPGDGSWSSPTDLTETDDGGYVITARTGENDAGLIRTDSQGTVQWTSVYQGADDEPETTRTVAGGGASEEDSTEVLTAVESHPDGGVVAVGRTTLVGSEGVVLFVDEDGTQTNDWRRSEAAFTDLTTVRESEEFVIAGRDEDQAFARNWSREGWDDIRPDQWESFDNVVRRAGGGYAFDVEIEDGYGLFTLDSDGDVAFERSYDEADDTPEEVVGGLVQTANRGFVLAGNGQADRSVWLVGTGPEGERRGSVTLDEGPGTSSPVDPNPLAATADGGVIGAYTANLGGATSDEQSDVRLAKVGPSLTAAPGTPTEAQPDEPTEDTPESDDDTGAGDADGTDDTTDEADQTPTETTAASDDETGTDEEDCEP